jgi:putative membrane-bound dehydrogenase-like protein
MMHSPRRLLRPACAARWILMICIAVGMDNARSAFAAESIDFPQSPDSSIKVSLFASEPQIVTPIGATVDRRGRLLVIESHSHFRPKNYEGPATDRIRIFEDTTHSGTANQIKTFYEGTNFLMHLAADHDGSVVVSSRNEIFRLIESATADQPPSRVTLAHLETKADYPHNGLHGLAVDAQGNVFFGIGENFGGPWTLVGTDGQKLSDDKGSGAIFRVDAKGAGLTLIARGFWNPFGLGFDEAGRLWTTDNDPDGRPPCRLIHVVPGGDYGFEFRYGRTGMHPLQAWNGELPGTLGMVSGVGEAPCDVIPDHGRLLVSSWRDHQVEQYTLTAHGAGFTATMKPLVTGGPNFRPVGLAHAPDGSLFITDWASSSYPIHRKGRIWKVTFTKAGESESFAPKVTEAAERARELRKSSDVQSLLTALDDSDPAIAQAAQYGLSQTPGAEKLDWKSLKSANQKIGLLAALVWRGTSLKGKAVEALNDADDRVLQMAVRCVTEQNLVDTKPSLEALLHSRVLSPRLLRMTIAAIGQLKGDRTGRIDSATINRILLDRLSAADATDENKSITLRMLAATHPPIPREQLLGLTRSRSVPLQLEAVRYLIDETSADRIAPLAQLAGDAKIDPAVRSEAIIGLSDDAAAHADLLVAICDGPDAGPRREALRALRSAAAKLSAPQREQLTVAARRYPEDRDRFQRLLSIEPPARPAETDLAGWEKILDRALGDADSGRRIFFNPSGGGCYHCHTMEGRGHAIGPDLTVIGSAQTRSHIVESILDPSREIAPLFTLWTIKTKSGQIIDGMLLRRDGQSKEVYVDSSGKETTVPEPDIVDRKMRKESLMPTGLVQGLTDQEFRDLMALLMLKR